MNLIIIWQSFPNIRYYNKLRNGVSNKHTDIAKNNYEFMCFMTIYSRDLISV